MSFDDVRDISLLLITPKLKERKKKIMKLIDC